MARAIAFTCPKCSAEAVIKEMIEFDGIPYLLGLCPKCGTEDIRWSVINVTFALMGMVMTITRMESKEN